MTATFHVADVFVAPVRPHLFVCYKLHGL
jgi:hypothetical protein